MKIGKVSATEKSPTTVNEFSFWLEEDVEVKPFDIVKTKVSIGNKESTTFGIIKDIIHLTDSPGHLSSFVSSDFGNVESQYSTQRLRLTLAIAEVIHNDCDVYMPCQDGSVVEFVTEEEVKKALGLDKINNNLPAGLFQMSNDISVPIAYNSDFLIGPEGAHMNISGISGLATKTSYAMFVLQGVQQTVSDDVAIVIFNVKGNDLLRIDEPNPHLKQYHRKQWEKVGLECKPFENVKYYYPYKNDKANFYSLTSCDKEALEQQVEDKKAFNYIYTYENDKSKIELLFSNVDDPNFTMESIINYISEHDEFDGLGWSDFKDKLAEYTKKGRADKDIPVQSWRKFRRLISKSITHSIFQESISRTPERRQVFLSDEIKDIQAGQVCVVDIAKLDEQVQCFVFGDVIKSIYELKMGETERDENEIPNKIIVFVDELNKYAPSNAPKNSPILNYILEITERGRSMGIVLFSAEQFRSAIHDRAKGNCSTNVYGRTNAIETSKSDYRYVPKQYTNMMTRLDKGDLLIEHPVFRTLLKISFPYPSYYQRK